MLRRVLFRGLLGLAALAVLAWVVLLLQRPATDRDWIPEHARQPQAAFAGDLVTITDLRDFREGPDGAVRRDHLNRTYDLSRLQSLWYVLAVFHPDGWRGPAHSMFSFGFDDGSYLVVSVEARKEVGETYSVWKGLRNQYEMIYVLGTEEDLVRTRAVYRPDDVYLYPVDVAPDNIRRLLAGMLEGANRLADHPEFYNTVTNNCTTRLRDHANQVRPGFIPHSWKVQLPGFSDELVRDLGLIDSSLPLEQERRKYYINARAREAADAPDFSARIRRTEGS